MAVSSCFCSAASGAFFSPPSAGGVLFSFSGNGAAGTCFSGVGVPQKSAPMRLRLCSVIERITSSCRRMISSFLL